MYPTNVTETTGDPILGFVILFVMAVLYFLPTIIAGARHHHSVGGVFVVDLFLGWTLLGWVAALAWAVSAVRRGEDDHAS